MKFVIFGANGSMGRRYTAICKNMGHTVLPIEIGQTLSPTEDFDYAIIATPTKTHFDIVKKLLPYNKTILCEKPVCFNLRRVKELRLLDKRHLVKVVCNWKFVKGMLPFNHNKIEYNFYNTGKDGLYYDCCQLVLLSHGSCILRTTSPTFMATVNGKSISLTNIENSYITMIEKLINHPEELWELKEGFEMTRLCNKLNVNRKVSLPRGIQLI